MVLEKDGDQFDQTCEKWSVTQSQGGEEYHTNNKRKANTFLMERYSKGKKGTGRWGSSHKQPLDEHKWKRGYWKLKEDSLDHTLWTTYFGRGYGPVTRQTTEIFISQNSKGMQWGWRPNHTYCLKRKKRKNINEQ